MVWSINLNMKIIWLRRLAWLNFVFVIMLISSLVPFVVTHAVAQDVTSVWVDDDWAGLMPGDPVNGHTFGIDAFAVIQNGIDTVNDLGTVYVAQGVYLENITIIKNVNLYGGYSSDFSVNDPGTYISTINGSGAVQTIYIRLPKSHIGVDVHVIDGFEIVGGGYGVWADSASANITNNTIKNNSGDGFNSDGRDILIEGNRIHNNGGFGIYGAASRSDIRKNEIWGNSGGGIYALAGHPSFESNIIRDNSGHGIYCDDSSINNITGNVITGNTGDGILIEESGPDIIENNFISNNGGMGIKGWEADKIVNNVVAGNQAGGINLSVYIIEIVNNTIAHNNGNGGLVQPVDDLDVIMNNIIWGNTPQDYSGDIEATYSCIGTGNKAGEGNISEDPLFVDPATDDYHLQSSSPCIDAGANAAVPPGITTDFEGDARIIDGDGDTIAVVDMGSDEYFALPNTPPQVTNVTASQGSPVVNITYDVTDGEQSDVSIIFEYWDGASWQSCTTATGEDTHSIGTGKTGTWDAKADFNGQYMTDSRIQVIANDEQSANNTGSGVSGEFTLDTKEPTGHGCNTPINGATDVSINPSLTCFAASDDSLPVSYYLQLAEDADFTLNLQESGWQSDTAWVPSTLSYNTQYLWRVKASDNYSNETDYGAIFSFTTEKVPPEVTTNAATDITDMTAALNGNLDSLGDYDTINVSFEWGTESGVYTANTTPEAMTDVGAFAVGLTGLDSDTPYYYRAKATGSVTVYGEEQTFTTYTLPPEVWVDNDWAGLNPGDPANGYTFGYNAFATIQDGVDGVENILGKVNVNDGTYSEYVSIDKSITLQSVNGAKNAIVEWDGVVGDTFTVLADNVNITGLTIMSLLGNFRGVLLEGVENCNISECIITNYEIGIYLSESSNNKVANNVIQNNHEGIVFSDSDDNEVLGNDILDNITTESGIHLDSSSSHNIILFNNIVGNLPYGVFNEGVSENISARNNWWGDVSGPGGAGPGTGDNVSMYIDYAPWITGEVDNAISETITDGILEALTEADTAVSVNGTATVTVAKYAGNPGSGFSGDIGKYIDVYINDVSAVNEVEIRLYYTDSDIAGKVESSLKLYWWDSSTWAVCSDTGVDMDAINGYSGYIWAKISDNTTPSLNDLIGTPFGATASATPSPPPSSGGGGGGGGGGPSDTTSLSEFTTSTGKFVIDATASSADGLVKIEIPKGTIGKDRNDNRLRFISIKKQSDPSLAPTNSNFVCLAYDIGPSGSTLDPFGYLIFKYSDADVPERVAEENLVLVNLQDGVWVELTDCVVNPDINTITAPISHFSIYTVLARTAPAQFDVTDMTVTPAEVDMGESITIGVTVTNTGDLTGSYTIVLKIGGSAVQEKAVTLDGSESQLVNFTLTQDTGGVYTVNIRDLSGSFTVKEPEGTVAEVPVPEPPTPSPEPPEPSPTPTTPQPSVEKPSETDKPEPQPGAQTQPPTETAPSPTAPWGLIIILVVGLVIVVGLGTLLYIRRHSVYSKNDLL